MNLSKNLQKIAFALFLTNSFFVHAKCGCNQDILEGKILENYQRYPTFVKALDLLSERQAKVIVETGTSRYGTLHCLGDGCSTVIFGEWVKNNGGEFYSVDIDKNAIKAARKALGSSRKFVKLFEGDSVEFLANFEKPIDFLYLDSFDFELDNPGPSQEHHLKEIKAAYPLLKKTSVVMIDDCDLPYGGKGKLAIDFLLERGWQIVADAYQVILVQE